MHRYDGAGELDTTANDGPIANATEEKSPGQVEDLAIEDKKEQAATKVADDQLDAEMHKELKEQATMDSADVITELDTDKDGHICKAELKAHYYKARVYPTDFEVAGESDQQQAEEELDMPHHLTGAPEINSQDANIRHEEERVYDPTEHE